MKYYLKCKKCGKVIPNFKEWFAMDQVCSCGSNYVEVTYNSDYNSLKELCKCNNLHNFFHYFDFLPINSKDNIVTCDEGTIPIERWSYLENIASEKYGINCKVFVYRNDLNGGTQTFKDVAAAMAASIFKENDIHEYCLASTGNTATAYSKYLHKAGIKFNVFVPNCVCEDTVEEIKSYHQNIVISEGDYADAKKMAADFHKNNHVLISMGNFDPIRVEAKKTMVFEFMRQLGTIPDVYIQAVSGGTGPIAVDKGVRDLAPHYKDIKLPKMLLVQQDTCDPMVQGWERAEKNLFPEGFEKDYPIIEKPQTKVSILSTGNPGMFPIVAPIVKKSGGTFLRVKEDDLVKIASIAKNEQHVELGPASAVCLAGFYKALDKKQIENNSSILINIGEGAKRAKKFASLL